MSQTRRFVVIGIVTALAGCLQRFQDEPVESSAEETLQMMEDGQLDTDSIHSNSPTSAEEISTLSGSLESDSISVIEEDDSRAVVAVNASIRNKSRRFHVEYRKEEGEWKLYEIRRANPPTGPQSNTSQENESEFQ
ncbi:MAG: hypothetical protein U5K37_03965 [Natrialbaceae archaeon]|nr:hypothetical protein [Natrialbaceae archaeon]